MAILRQALRSTETPYLAALLLLFVAWVSSNVSWLRRDEASMPYADSYNYLSRTLRFVDALQEPPRRGLGDRLGDLSLVGRPPLYQLLTIPAIFLWGRSGDAALSINIFFLALLLLATYGIGRRRHGPAAGLLAALLVGCYPPTVHLSRMYLPHFALLAIAAASLWLLLSLIEKPTIRGAWALGIALTAGILTHPYFAWIAALPSILVGIFLIFSKGGAGTAADRRRFLALGLLPAAAVAGGATALWYLTHGTVSFEQMQSLMERGRSSIGFPDVERSFGWYLATAPGVMTNVLAGLAAAAVVGAILRRQLADWVLLSALFSAYVMLSQAPVLAWIYGAAMLPVAAVLSALWIFDRRPAWLRRGLATVAAGAALFSFCFVTWDPGPRSRSVAALLGSPLADRATCRARAAVALCPTAPDPRSWPWDELRDLMLADHKCRLDRPCKVLLVDVDGVAPHAMNHYLTRERLHKVIKVAYHNRNDPFSFHALFGDYLLHPSRRTKRHHSANDRAAAELLLRPPAEFAKAHRLVATLQIPGSGPKGSRLIRRRKSLTVAEAEAVIAALDLPDSAKASGFLVLARMYAAPGADRDKSEVHYRRFLALQPDHVGAHFELAQLYVKRGATDAALAELEAARALNPKSRRVKNAIAKIHRNAQPAPPPSR